MKQRPLPIRFMLKPYDTDILALCLTPYGRRLKISITYNNSEVSSSLCIDDMKRLKAVLQSDSKYFVVTSGGLGGGGPVMGAC